MTSYEIAVPTTKILEKFNKSVSPLFSTIIKNKQESSNLAQLRDFLLPLLMNGQITISEEQNKPIIAPFSLFADDDTYFQTWKEQIGVAVANCSGVMEADTISKNRVSSKNHVRTGKQLLNFVHKLLESNLSTNHYKHEKVISYNPLCIGFV